jgi:hypothetical protein
MQGTSVEVLCVNSLLPLFMSGVIIHTTVKRQKSNSYFCMPTRTKEGFLCIVTYVLTVWFPIHFVLAYVTTGHWKFNSPNGYKISSGTNCWEWDIYIDKYFAWWFKVMCITWKSTENNKLNCMCAFQTSVEQLQNIGWCTESKNMAIFWIIEKSCEMQLCLFLILNFYLENRSWVSCMNKWK